MPTTYTMEITPSAPTVPLGQHVQFTATKVGSDGSRTNPPVIWTTNAGTIDEDGIFTPSTEEYPQLGPSFVNDEGATITYYVTATENDSG
jgi:hypothetical protein